jgi:hypothetical protein
MIAAPDNIVAINVSCPGASTNDTVRSVSAFVPHTPHTSDTVYASGSGHFGHFLKVTFAYPSLMEMPRLISSLC